MKMTIPPSNQQGFSLVELLVAISILAVGLLALADLQTVAMKSGSVAQKISVSTSLGREAMEDIMSWDPGNAGLNASAANVVYLNNFNVAGAGTFNVTYTTSCNSPAVGTTRVDVTVTGSGIQPLVITGYKKVV